MAGNKEDVHTQWQQQLERVATSPTEKADDNNEQLPISVYVSDDEKEVEDDVAHNHWARRSKRVQQNLWSH